MAIPFVAGGGIQSKSISDFDPRTLGGCMLWLDAADSNTVFRDTEATDLAVNGGLVARWNDKANPGKFVRQNTSAKRPSYVVSSNSLPALNFTGIGGDTVGFEFSDISTPPMPTGTNPATYFIVAKPSLASGGQSGGFIITYGPSTNGTKDERYIVLYGGTSNNLARFGVGSGVEIDVQTGNITQTTILTAVYSDFTASLTTNGGARGTRNVQSTNPNTGTAFYNIGDYYGGSPFYGYINEILVFNRALQNDERQQVEGYLAWKWGVVQNLPTTHPYYYAKLPQSAFQPTNLPLCALWLDAADTNSITFSGSNVTQWNDKSGNRSNLVSNASFLRPTYLSSEKSLNFTAIANTSATVLENTSLPAITSTSITVFGVYKHIAQASGATAFQRFIAGAAASDDDYVTPTGFNLNANSANTGIVYERNNGSLSANASNTSPFILSFVLNGTASAVGSFAANTQYIFQNGSQLTSGTGLSNGTAFNLQRIRLGTAAHFTDANTTFCGYNGTISEVLFYRTVLTSSQVQQVEGYLAWKWGLQANLPSNHLFNSANYFFNNTRPFSRYFSPTDIDDCLLWIDAADASTVILTGSNVTTVRDKSGTANDITNSSSILTYTGTINGLNTITCPASATGTNNFLLSPSRPRDPLNHSYFLVCRYPTTNVNVTRFINMSSQFFGHTYNASNEAYIENNNTAVGGGPQYTFYPGTFTSQNQAFGGNTFLLASVRQNSVYNITGNGITQSSNTNSNGTSIGTTVANTSSTTYSITPPLNTGANVGGQLAEVIIYNRGLSTPERQIVEGYLAWKWGIANNRSAVMTGTAFPTTHPYASYPPVSMPILPLTKLYKKSLDPADLSPVLWFDPQDSATYAVNANNRLTSWTSKGSNKLQLGTITGVNGPLITRSTTPSSAGVSQGTGFQFADFSAGGYFQITGAQLTTTTNLRLTLFPSSHAILSTRQVTFSNLAGTLTGATALSSLINGSFIVAAAATSTIDITVGVQGATGTYSGVNGAVEYGNITIASANVTAATTLTITTSQPHGLSGSPADTVALNFTSGTLPSSAAATTLNAVYILASVVNSTQITITIPTQGASTGALTGTIAGVVIFPSAGCGLDWTSASPVTSTAGGTLVCVTHLPRTPVRNSTLRNSFLSASTTNGTAAGDTTASNGTDFKLILDNTGAAIRKNAGITASIGNTQLTAGFNVMNATFNTNSVASDIAANVNGISVKGWRYDTALSNSNYNATGGLVSSNLSLAQIRIGGNTNATQYSPLNTHWYEGGLGDIFFFDRVLTLEERQLLEGWLSQKYGCSSTLGATSINTGGAAVGSSIHPYRLNQTNISSTNTLGTPITSPIQISNNLAAWFDATYSPTLSTSHTSFTNISIPNDTGIGAWGSRGGFWSQAIGGAGCVNQPTSGRRPRYILNSVNGLPGLRFSGGAAGSEYALDTAGGSGRVEYMLATQDVHPNTTLIGVIIPTTSTSSTILSFNQVSGGSYGITLAYGTDSKITFSLFNSSTNQSIQSDALTNGNAYIVIARRRGIEMLIKTIGAGVVANPKTSNAAALSLIGSASAYLRLGNNFGGGSSPFLGDINEIMLFRSALTDQAIQHIEGYLAWKWGLQANLLDTHAYKRFSP